MAANALTSSEFLFTLMNYYTSGGLSPAAVILNHLPASSISGFPVSRQVRGSGVRKSVPGVFAFR
jgi:hypothetical protein